MESTSAKFRIWNTTISLKALTALLFVLVLGFYLFTMQPSLAWGDGAKLQLEAITGESFIFSDFPEETFAHDPYPFAKLGVAAWDHPLYIVIGYTLTRALPGVSALWLVNLMSVTFGAGAVVLLFRLLIEGTGSLWASAGAALMLAVSHTFWWHSSTPEVYTLFAFLLLLTLYLYIRFERDDDFRFLVASAFMLGLSAANHIMSFLALPALVLYWWLDRDRKFLHKMNLQRVLILGASFFSGVLLLLVQAIRMLRIFPLSEIMGPVVGSVFINQLLSTTVLDVLVSFLTYFGFTLLQFGPVGFILGIYGLMFAHKNYSQLWRKTIALYLVFAVFGVLYRVSDQFAFFLTAHIFFAIAIGLGTAQLMTVWAEAKQQWVSIAVIASIVIMPVFYRAIPGIAANLNIDDATIGVPQIGTGLRNGLAYYLDPYKRGDHNPYNFGLETIEALPENAFVVAQWYPDTDEYLTLRYFNRFEGMRQDITVAGWTPVDPFVFDSNIIVDEVKRQIEERPVFLASLDVDFYQADYLMKNYCIATEANLYRVFPFDSDSADAVGIDCLSDPDLLIYTFSSSN